MPLVVNIVLCVVQIRVYMYIVDVIEKKKPSCVYPGTSYIAIEQNVVHLKSYEFQWNRCAQAILPLIVFL